MGAIRHSQLRSIKLRRKTSSLGVSLLFGVTLLIVVGPCGNASAQEGPLPLNSLIESSRLANQKYDSAYYGEAIELYQQAINSGWESADLHYNIGNAYFELGDLGHAILSYSRAQRLDPSDLDIADNLRFARRFVGLQLEGVELNPFVDYLKRITSNWSLDAWGWLTSVAFVMLSLIILWVILGRPDPVLYRLPIILFGLTLVTLVALTSFKYQSEFSYDRAVVIESETPVTSRPSDDSEIEFRATSGLEIRITSSSGDYFLALFENKRQGWIPKTSAKRL